MTSLNNTITGISSFSGFGSWFSTVIVFGIAAIVLSIFVMMLSSLQNYKRIKGWLGWLINTIKYFFFGGATLITLAVPGLIFYYFISQARKGNVVPLKITAYIILGYFGITLIGYLAKKLVINRIKQFQSKLKKERNEKSA